MPRDLHFQAVPLAQPVVEQRDHRFHLHPSQGDTIGLFC